MSIQHRSHDPIGAKTSCKIGTYPTLFQHLTDISKCLTKCSCFKFVLERVEQAKFDGNLKDQFDLHLL